MATIRGEGTNIELGAYELIGQSPFCSLVFDDALVSGEHARIHWDGSAWVLKDLGSMNRTFVDGQPLDPGGRTHLTKGSTIAFGSAGCTWTVASIAPPPASVMAVPMDREGRPDVDAPPVYATGGLLGLPSHERPLATLYRNRDGAWRLEGQPTPVEDQSVLTVGEGDGRRFRILVPTPFVETKPVGATESQLVRDAKLRFLVSPDLEHIELEVGCGRSKRNLGSHRHNEVLHVLARCRAEQARLGGEHDRDGWVHQDYLCRAVGNLDRGRLNTEVYRARKQFAELDFLDPAQIIERRPRVGDLRLGTEHFEETVLEGI